VFERQFICPNLVVLQQEQPQNKLFTAQHRRLKKFKAKNKRLKCKTRLE